MGGQIKGGMVQKEWSVVLDEVERNVSDMVYATYFKNLKLISSDDGIISIEVPNVFIRTQMEKKYNNTLRDALLSTGLDCKELHFQESNNETKKIRKSGEVLSRKNTIKKDSIERKAFLSTAKVGKNGLNPKYRLDNYIVGSNNDLAVSAAKAIIDNPGTRYNPYFIYGGPGLGKTHLIQAIGNELVEKYPDMKVLYVTIEQFYHDFVEAMRKKLDGFTDKYRKIDCLIIDDFQFIVGKEKSQDEFFHTFNELHQKNKQIIVSSDRLPTQIASVDERLSSRLMMGMPIDIQMPDFEVRCAILKSKAELVGADIDNKTVEFLAEHIKSNIRDLEGKLNQILAMSELRNIPPSQLINDGYMDESSFTPVKNISPKKIIDKVARYYNLKSEDLLGKSRVKSIKSARQVAMYLLSEELGLSTVKIGTEFNKDHTTIMHGIKIIKDGMKLDFNLREQIADLRSKIYG